MNYTPNYQLNQWEATDQVKRADFNADNAKIDAAILAARKAPCCIHGTYVGNGGTVTVDLGFRPSFLVIMPQEYANTAYAYNSVLLIGGPERMARFIRSGGGTSSKYVTWLANGFQVTDANADAGFCATDVTFHYFAFY